MTLKLERDDVGRMFRTRDGKLAVIRWTNDVTTVSIGKRTHSGLVGSTFMVWGDDGRNVYDNANDLVHRLSDEECDALEVAQAFKDL